MNRAVSTLLSLMLLPAVTGCLFLPGRAGLERLREGGASVPPRVSMGSADTAS